jgi:predicted sugar kinase
MIDLLIIAQLDKLPENYLVWWLIAFGGLALIVQTVMNVTDRFRPKKATSTMLSPDPLQVQEVEKLATKAELEMMSGHLRKDIEGLRRSIDDEKRTNFQENGKLHARVDEVVETLAETKGLLIGVKENTDRLLQRSMK